MSYSVSGVAAISFPIPALHDDAYSVPGSHRVLTPIARDTHPSVDSSVSAASQTQPAATVLKSVEVKHASPVDTVTLSTSEKVLRLQREGESTLQIAATLNLPTKEVQSDLHAETHTPQSFTVAPIVSPQSGNTTATVSVPTAGV